MSKWCESRFIVREESVESHFAIARHVRFFHWLALTREKSRGMLPKKEDCPHIWQTKNHSLNEANKVRGSVHSLSSPFSYNDALYLRKCISFSESQRNIAAWAGFSTVLNRKLAGSNNYFIIILAEYYISCYLYKYLLL